MKSFCGSAEAEAEDLFVVVLIFLLGYKFIN